LRYLLFIGVLLFILWTNRELIVYAALLGFLWLLIKYRPKKSHRPSRPSSGIFGTSNEFEMEREMTRKVFGISKNKSDKEMRKELEEIADFYRRHDGPRWKIEEADRALGRSEWESEYEDEKWKF